jgi:hypothetical protein
MMRFCSVRPRNLIGVKTFGVGFPSVWSSAVPAGGSCAGVKYGIPFAGLLYSGLESSVDPILMTAVKYDPLGLSD